MNSCNKRTVMNYLENVTEKQLDIVNEKLSKERIVKRYGRGYRILITKQDPIYTNIEQKYHFPRLTQIETVSKNHFKLKQQPKSKINIKEEDDVHHNASDFMNVSNINNMKMEMDEDDEIEDDKIEDDNYHNHNHLPPESQSNPKPKPKPKTFLQQIQPINTRIIKNVDDVLKKSNLLSISNALNNSNLAQTQQLNKTINNIKKTVNQKKKIIAKQKKQIKRLKNQDEFNIKKAKRTYRRKK